MSVLSFKNTLQEYLQSRRLPLPTYHSKTVSQNPHLWKASITVQDLSYSTPTTIEHPESIPPFRSKKLAEQFAAYRACVQLKIIQDNPSVVKQFLEPTYSTNISNYSTNPIPIMSEGSSTSEYYTSPFDNVSFSSESVPSIHPTMFGGYSPLPVQTYSVPKPPKNQLQEFLQDHQLPLPQYNTNPLPDLSGNNYNSPRWIATVTIYLPGGIGQKKFSSEISVKKKLAEANAASKAMKFVDDNIKSGRLVVAPKVMASAASYPPQLQFPDNPENLFSGIPSPSPNPLQNPGGQLYYPTSLTNQHSHNGENIESKFSGASANLFSNSAFNANVPEDHLTQVNNNYLSDTTSSSGRIFGKFDDYAIPSVTDYKSDQLTEIYPTSIPETSQTVLPFTQTTPFNFNSTISNPDTQQEENHSSGHGSYPTPTTFSQTTDSTPPPQDKTSANIPQSYSLPPSSDSASQSIHSGSSSSTHPGFLPWAIFMFDEDSPVSLQKIRPEMANIQSLPWKVTFIFSTSQDPDDIFCQEFDVENNNNFEIIVEEELDPYLFAMGLVGFSCSRNKKIGLYTILFGNEQKCSSMKSILENTPFDYSLVKYFAKWNFRRTTKFLKQIG